MEYFLIILIDDFHKSSKFHYKHDICIIFIAKQNVLKSIPLNIGSWQRKTIMQPNYWPSYPVLQWMSIVLNRDILNMVLLHIPDLHSVYGWLGFCFTFLDKFDVYR